MVGSTPKPRLFSSIRARLLGWLLLSSLVPTALTAYFVISSLEEQIGGATGQRMDEVAQGRERALRAWIEQVLNDGRVFAALPATAQCLESLSRALDRGDADSADYRKRDAECLATLNFIGLSFLYDVMLVDRDGRVVMSQQKETPPSTSLFVGAATSGATRLAQGLHTAIDEQGASFVPHEMYAPTGAESAFATIPIVRGAEVLGVLVLQLNNREFLRPLEAGMADTRSGELLLLRREGKGEVLVLTPPRGHPELAFTQRFNLAGTRGLSLQAALAGPAGRGLTQGDRGEPVFAAWRPLPDYGWGLVARIGAEEALAPVRAIKLALLPIVAGLLLATAAIAIVLGWRLVRPLQRFTAFSREVAAGNLGGEVGYAGHDELGELASTLNAMSARLAYSTASLQRAKGMLEVRVAERTAELTEKAQNLEAAERVANLGHWETDWRNGRRYWSPQVYRILGLRPGNPDPAAFRQRIHKDDRALVSEVIERACADGKRFSIEFRLAMDDGSIRWVREEGDTALDDEGRPAKSVGIVIDITERQLAEQALRRSEASARSVLEAAQEGIIIISRADRSILYANPAAERMFGRGKDELLGFPTTVLYPEDARKQVEAEFSALIRAHGGRASNLPAVRSNGERFVVDIFASEIRYEERAAMFGFFTDVTELRAAEAERARLEQELIEARALRAEVRAETILDAVDEGVVEVDSEGHVRYMNQTALRTFGVSAEAVIGRHYRDAVPLEIPDHSADTDGPFAHVLRTGEPVSGEGATVRMADGGALRAAYYIRPLAAAAGSGVLLVFRDITERERQQLRLQLMSSAVEQSASAILITDTDGHIEYVNPKFCALYGFEPSELIGETPRRLKSGHTTAAEYQGLWRTILGGGEWHGEFLNLRKDGEARWVAAAIASLRDPDGRPTHFIGVHEDITERKAIESELTQAREVAETAARAKSEFLARMSHEIRTPMNAIIGLSDLALQGPLALRERDFIIKVNRSAQSLLGIINDVLDFSRIDAGRLELESVEFALDDVLQHLADMVHTRVHDGVELYFDTPPEVPARFVGDPLRLGQVLVNLCSNATKFTRTGFIAVRVRCVEATPGTVTLGFEVEDSGDGIPADRLPLLFDAFSQAEASIARRFGGSGLGLAICRQLVRLMGGEIRVRSTEGVGSSFAFTVQLGRVGSAAEFPMPGALVGRRVLWAAPPSRGRELLRERCVELGLEVSLADSMPALCHAIDAAREQGSPYDVLLVDCSLPGDVLPAWRCAAPPPLVNVCSGSSCAEFELHLATTGLCTIQRLDRPVTRKALVVALTRALGCEDAPAPEVRRHTAAEALAALAGSRVLVVDDAELNQEVAREYLQSVGVSVALASNGAEAVAMLAQQRFDAVLMDCQMPVMDGYAATRALRQQDALASLPIIALTANALAGERERVLEAGMNDFISKPVDPERLFDVLMRWIAPLTPPLAAAPARASMPAMLSAAAAGTGGAPGGTSTPPDGVPPLPGVDTAVGLARAMGRPKTYLKYLRIFHESHAGFAANFDAARSVGDAALAQRLAHTLKSGAASIGALEVEAAAIALESLLREGGDAAAVSAARDRLCDALTPLLAALAALQTATA
ncbi:PAS domain S-box protein [Niveibacterium sp. COAC-50]|uniref:PAS domain S-box protein n=1 Tax=Niveibacterium sp. COAC-50 TaxID=2729384 RepID=UPI00155633E3